MSTTYTKLFQSILDSTVWQESASTKLVWITLLAMTDREGCVWASVPGLARRAGVEIPECEAALTKFLSPDPYSRSVEHEGRRVEVIDGGWKLLNHAKYREMMSLEDRREYQRLKQAEYRKRRKEMKREARCEGAAEAIADGLAEDNGEPTGVDL